MLISYTYGQRGTRDRMIIALEELEPIPPLFVDLGDTRWIRISDTVLTCEPALYDDGGKKGSRMVKCGNWECHRTVLGSCMCGLHPSVRIEAAD